MLLMIDNYDSFTYNLVQYLGELGADGDGGPQRRDHASTRSSALQPERIVISPGPCTPNEAGISLAADRALRRQDPDPRRLPRPSGDRPGVRRQGRARADRSCTARPRRSTTTGAGVFAGLPSPFVGDALPLAGGRARRRCPTASRSPPGPRTARSWACATSTLAGRGRAVPPGVDPDRARARAAEELPGAVTGIRRSAWPSPPQEALQRTHRAPRDLPRRDARPDAPDHERRRCRRCMIAAIIIGLRVKKETIGEITAAAQVMRELATKVHTSRIPTTWSTWSAPAATARTPSTSPPRRRSSAPRPARAWPSTATARCRRKSGSADVLEALGVNIDLTPEQVGPLHRRGRRRASCSRRTTTRR